MTNYYTIADLSQKLGITRKTLWVWINSGKFPEPYSLNDYNKRWDKEKVDNWLKQKQGQK